VAVGQNLNLITNYVQQSSSEEADSNSAVNQFPSFYGTWRFITVFTRATTGPYPESDVCSPHVSTLFPSRFPDYLSCGLPLSHPWFNRPNDI